MKDELIIDGIRYKRVAEELTLEDCVKDTFHRFSGAGFWNGVMPTIKMAEKHFLYGLLMCVAYKLNEGKEGGRSIIYLDDNRIDVTDCVFRKSDEPKFYTNELARQAIRIFENSKFDLKKLFQ
jgi:hypothetical protein